MSMKKLTGVAVPRFDPKKPHGTIYGSGSESSTARAAFCQNGHYFAGDHAYLGSDIDAKNVAAQADVPEPAQSGARFVRDEEIDELLKSDQAPGLLNLPLPTLAAMVARAGGPSFAGDHAPRQYVAWLLRFTQHDG